MAFDISRFTFDPWKNFSAVVMEQGRVQLDSDWNERDAELSRRIQAGTLDIFGQAAYPATTPAAFQITGVPGPAILIGCGRMYVDGLLAENHGERANAEWDPALAELSGSPQPPVTPPPPPTANISIDFLHQPYLPGATLPPAAGTYLFYLDVWSRPVTFLEDNDLIDKAVGVDTTGRLQTVWQVKYLSVPSGATCATPVTYPSPSAGRLTTNIVPLPNAGPCCLTTGSGYTGVENQCFRVEIHQGGAGSDTASTTGAVFKWSRDNASVATAVTAITSGTDTAGKPASVLAVTSLGRDQVLGFHPGDWIEILDNWTELNGIAGTLCQIDSVSVPNRTITLTSQVPTGSTAPGNFPVDTNGLTDPTRRTRIIRWDQRGTVYKLNGTQLVHWCDLAATGGAIPVPLSDTVLVLESGITVVFSLESSNGAFNVGDFWIFDARTADGSVEILHTAPPVGIHHHYTKLAIVNYDPTSNSTPAATGCRTPWPPAGASVCGCCCAATVGEGGQYSSINQAIAALPAGGGEVCILPGKYPERVTISGRKDVVIRGCGAQTRVVSPGTVATGTTESGLTAVVTVVGSQNVRLCSFAVEAGEDDVGVLLDRAKSNPSVKSRNNAGIAIEDMVIAASAFPAIAAVDPDVLQIAGNRIAMKNVASVWPSVYARGTQMRIERNWIGLQNAPDVLDWIPATIATDLSLAAGTGGSPQANGGIQIAGSSRDAFITGNEIEGGRRNGITLGSFVLLDGKKDTGALTGVLAAEQSPGGITLQLPESGSSGGKKGTVSAAAGVKNIRIARNRIRNMGLCGIGPVGFFNLERTTEVISIENLAIAGNTVFGTLQDTVAPFREKAPLFGYGAICLPDVQHLIVRDNLITDFGNVPGAQVCGIYVLMGELVEISGNRILETRDWSKIPKGVTFSPDAVQAGIAAAVTPPALDQAVASASASSELDTGKLATPVYQPGLPALRVENNVVRIPLGPALDVFGYGPFSILGNHFASGGTLTAANDPAASGPHAVLTVLIMNPGRAIELDVPSGGFLELWRSPPQHIADTALATSSCGAVLFANNFCQLEGRASAPSGFASVSILSRDHLIFSNNQCWLDNPAKPPRVFTDALLLAGSVNVCGNRFQEASGSVHVSGITCGGFNVTAQNISTFCLFAEPEGSRTVISANNLVIAPTLCPKLAGA